MKIGELARRSGVGIDAIRFYERETLLPPPARQASGYRQYDVDTLDRLRFIRRAKVLGFSLTEIRDLLALSQQAGSDMAAMRRAAALKLADVDAKLTELSRIREALAGLVAACPGHGELETCPIINALAGKSA